jgi:hypothetical protein
MVLSGEPHFGIEDLKEQTEYFLHFIQMKENESCK